MQRELNPIDALSRNSHSNETVYQKPRSQLEEHERACIDHLEANGIFPTVLAEDPRAPANIDLMIDGQLWEMKNVTNHRSSVKNQFKRVREK